MLCCAAWQTRRAHPHECEQSKRDLSNTTLVDEIVSVYCASQGKFQDEIENILDAGLGNLLKDRIPRCCGKSFVDTSTYTEWNDRLYVRRNHIVHEGASVNGDEADEALAAGQQAMEWLKQRAARRPL